MPTWGEMCQSSLGRISCVLARNCWGEGIAYTRLIAWNELRYITGNICFGVGNCSIGKMDASMRAWYCNRISFRTVAHGSCAKASEFVCSMFISDAMCSKTAYDHLADDQMYALFTG